MLNIVIIVCEFKLKNANIVINSIQIANALPMHEVPTAEEPSNKKGSDNSPQYSTKPEHDVKDISDTLNSKCESESESESSESEYEDQDDNGHNYNNMEDFVRETIRDHLGDHLDFDSMSEESERQLYEMFCAMNIISV